MDKSLKAFWVVMVGYLFCRGIMSIPSVLNFGNSYITGLFHGVGICAIIFSIYLSFVVSIKDKNELKNESNESENESEKEQ